MTYEPDDWDYPDSDWEEEQEDEWENAMQECGIVPDDGGCTLAGTEYCDFECPFRDHPEWLLGEDGDEP